jgi:hypothetical protein
LKAAVLRSDWFDPELNPKLSSFCEHYGTVVLPTKPARPEHKGKVEAGVKYVQNNALKGKEFESLNGQNLYLTKWERTVADTRIHGTTRQQVGSFFEGNERAALQPLPDSLFPVFSEAKRKVHRDGYVEVGVTHLIAPIIPLRPTVGKATGATLKSSVTVNGKNVRVKLDGDEGNPLMPGSPGITYTITINFNGTTGRATFSGEHDGFPSYDFYAGRMIRNWSHVQAGTTPRALFPPMDQPFQGGFKTEVCCE